VTGGKCCLRIWSAPADPILGQFWYSKGTRLDAYYALRVEAAVRVDRPARVQLL
jgi:hypothetical protein